MATLTVTRTEDYSDGNPAIPADTESIVFSNGGQSQVMQAIFGSNQFGAGLISDTVVVTGDVFQNFIRVNMSAAGTFSAANWTFANWTFGFDFVNLVGTSGADTIIGSSQNDLITGGDGLDNISAGAGDDSIRLEADDLVAGETIDGGSQTTPTGDVITLLGLGVFDFTGVTVTNVERLSFSAGDITAILSATQLGAGGISQITGAAGQVQILIVSGGNANLSGVTFTNWSGSDHEIAINGTAAAETLIGSSYDDSLDGGTGNDSLSGSTGFDTLHGGDDNDTLGGGDQGDSLFGDGGDDVLNGGMGLDTIDGGVGNDTINGGLGGDTIFGNLGFDEIHGNDGNDTINGGDQGDLITGDAGNDFIGGGMGLDTIDGGAGNDTITGGMGNDQLTGGADADTFAFGAPGPANDGLDTLTDFVSGTDTIQISAAGYGGGLVASAAVTLVTADSAANANSGAGGYFIFDNTGVDTGTVYWDVNGGNGADAVAIAVLTGVAALQVADVHVM